MEEKIKRGKDYEKTFGFTDVDERMRARLDGFIPDKIFDAHNHIYLLDQMPQGKNNFTIFGEVNTERILNDQRLIFGERKFGALFVPSPAPSYSKDKCLRDRMTDWLCSELDKCDFVFGALYALPGDCADDLRGLIKHPRLGAFCCYAANSTRNGDTNLSDMDEYIPEAAWEIAEQRGMPILVHMAKPDGIGDADNRRYIRTMCERYPNAKLILAHGARGFASFNIIENARLLADIPNLYYDISVICDSSAMAELIRQSGAERVLWGSDYFVDRVHFKPFAYADEYGWINPTENEGLNFKMPMTVFESMFALYQASLLLDLSREDIEKIFWRNGAGLFGIEF